MKTQPALIARFRKMYEDSKKYIVFIDLIIIVAFLYFGDFLGPLRQVLFPAAIVSILGILMDTLFRLEANITDSPKELQTINEAIPIINEILLQKNGITNVEIIAATGATTINAMLLGLPKGFKPSDFDISLYIVNPSSVCAKWFPSHWAQEVQMTTTRIQDDLKNRGFRIKLYYYDNLPNIHGVMINRKHLFMGFFGWKNDLGTNQLSGAERPHRYLRRIDSEAEYYFELFEDWLENSPHQLIYQSP